MKSTLPIFTSYYCFIKPNLYVTKSMSLNIAGMEPVEEDMDDPPTTCGICGEPHNCTDCDIIETNLVVDDAPVPSRARLSLPPNLIIEAMCEGTYSIVASQVIHKGTRFGPFEAKKVFSLNPATAFPLKVFQEGDYFKEMYLDSSNEAECNWMYFVQPANNMQEQNLVCYQDNVNIFYVTIRKIEVGEHFKVWYAPYYCQLMNKQLLECDEDDFEEMDDENLDMNELIKAQQGIREREIWICKFCGRQDTDMVNFATHISAHYNMQLRRKCDLCKETFKSGKSLKKHMTLAHSNEMYNLSVENAKISTMNKEINRPPNIVGGPLLNAGQLDNCNVLLDHMMLPNFDMDQSNLMLENELNLGVDSLLSETENFDFSIPASGEEKFVCDICVKPFEKLRSLILHLALHTGKYTCKMCKKIFSRNENLVSHRCNSQLTCSHCDHKFVLKKYLNRHMALYHNNINYPCEKGCKKVFTSQKSLEMHNCPEPVKLNCNVCQKEFYNTRNLNRHMRSHYAKDREVILSHLCEICSKQFKNKKMLLQHLSTHKEPQFTCQVCLKQFARRATFLDHMETHKEASKIVCTVCNQKFTLKKYLTIHMRMHDTDLKFKCSECPQRFRQKANMMTHFNRMHRRKCPDCDEVFMTAEKLKQHSVKHYEKCYECPLCKHVMKMKSSLSRHLKRKHPGIALDQLNIRCIERNIVSENNNVTECIASPNLEACDADIVDLLDLKDGKDDVSCLQDIDSNLEYMVNSYDANHLIENNFNNADDRSIVKNLVESELDFNSLEMEFEKNFNTPNETSLVNQEVCLANQEVCLSNQEVCLSMPDLGDVEQNITLGSSAYILENGTIVDSVEQGKILYYVLGKDQNKAN